MTETSWPFDSGTVDETTWSRMARVWGGTGIVGYAAGTSAQVYGDSSGRQVKIKAGQAQVRGHHWYSDAEVTKSIGANSSGNPRIDRVVLRLDPSANSLALAVLAGTPGSSPSAPALTQTDSGTYELSLAQVYVANGASTISAGNVTEERTFIPDRGVPVGSVQFYAAAAAPAGWLLANGAAVSRNDYSQLFALIGTTYGAGNGSTTFNLPDLRGRVPVGLDSGQAEFDALNDKGGSKTHTLLASQIPAHTHTGTTSTNGDHNHIAYASTGTGSSNRLRDIQSNNGLNGYPTSNAGSHNHTFTTNANTGGGGSHPILQPYITLNAIIKT
jgi:microcystin-dependent protein